MLVKDLAGPFESRAARTAAGNGMAYVAVGRRVYRVLPHVEQFCQVDFDIEHLLANPSGTLIAVAGTQRLLVFSDDGSIEMALSHKHLRKLLWHPAAVNDACLLALVPGAVYMHYMAATGLVSEKIDLTNTAASGFDHSSSLIIEVRDMPSDAVSMAFGSEGDETGPLTLLLGTVEGDLFALAPLVPPRFALTRASAEALLSYAVAEDFDYREHGDGTDGRVFRRQLSWVHDVHRQLSGSEVFWRNGERLHEVNRPSRPALAIQGPFNVQPYPAKLYEQDVFDIACVRVGEYSLLVQGLTSAVAVHLLSAPIPLMWAEAKSDDPPALPLVQVLAAPEGPKSLEVAGSLFFVHAGDSTTVYEPIAAFGSVLEDAAQVATERLFTATKLARSVVSSHRTYTLTLGLDEAAATAKKWRRGPQREGEVRRSPSGDADPASRKHSPAVHYESALGSGEGSAEMKALLASVRVRPSVGALKAAIVGDDAKSLESLTTASDIYTTELGKIYKAVTLAVRQIDLQKQELHQQLAAVEKIRAQIAKLSSEARSGEREKAIAERSDAIGKRVAALSERLAKTAQGRPLSTQEVRWAAEVRRLADRLDGTDEAPGLAARAATAENLLAVHSKPEPGAAWTSELVYLRRQLDTQDQRIRDLRAQLAELQVAT